VNGAPWAQVLAIAVGASLGALARWQAGLRLGIALGWLPVGTLAVNALGGLCIGLALAYFRLHPGAELTRLFCVVGFLGGLTTFSAFSGESLKLLIGGRWLEALLHASLHVLGALLMAGLGHTLGRWCWPS
jgi:CrcB protein